MVSQKQVTSNDRFSYIQRYNYHDYKSFCQEYHEIQGISHVSRMSSILAYNSLRRLTGVNTVNVCVYLDGVILSDFSVSVRDLILLIHDWLTLYRKLWHLPRLHKSL